MGLFRTQLQIAFKHIGHKMTLYKIEMTLQLNEQSDLEWMFQAIRELLEDGETIQTARYKQIDTESV